MEFVANDGIIVGTNDNEDRDFLSDYESEGNESDLDGDLEDIDDEVKLQHKQPQQITPSKQYDFDSMKSDPNFMKLMDELLEKKLEQRNKTEKGKGNEVEGEYSDGIVDQSNQQVSSSANCKTPQRSGNGFE